MAEKPRLKKSDEILGSIVPEPSRNKRAGGRASNKEDGQSRGGADTKAKSGDEFFEEDIELTDGPILPSAQSLAEKLLAKKPARQPGLGAYEPPAPSPRPVQAAQPKPEKAQPAPNPPAPKPAAQNPPAPPQPTVEFGHSALESTPAPAPVEFQAAPSAAASATIEFGVGDEFSPVAPNLAQPARARGERASASRTQPSFQEPEPEATVSEYTFQSFEDAKAPENTASVWEFAASGDDETRRERRERKPEKPREPEKSQPAQAQPQSQPRPRKERIIQPLQRPEPLVSADYEPQPEPRQAAFPYESQPQPQRPEPPVATDYEPEPRQAAFSYESQPQQAPPPPPQPEISEAERNRQDFLKRIASQFEVQFEEKFGDGVLNARENIRPGEAAVSRELMSPQEPPLSPPEPAPIPRAPLSAPEPKSQTRSARQTPEPFDDASEGEDFLAYVQRQERERRLRMDGDAERRIPPPAPEPAPAQNADEPALGFIEKFEKDIRKEEQQRSEDFKETLSQKFMRERERYLKELNIDAGEPDPPTVLPEPESAIPPRRKLDFQIQPEMHMPAGISPPNPRPASGAGKQSGGPVTYSRGGAIRPQADVDDDSLADEIAASGIVNNAVSGINPTNVNAASGGKKTGEQLLLEHSRRARGTSMSVSPQSEKLKFTFETPDERAQKAKEKKESLLPTEKWPRRLVLIAMIAGFCALVLVIWSMYSYYHLSSGLASAIEFSEPEAAPVVEDTLEIYNDRVFTQTASANTVLFKYAGTILKNVNVNDYVIIENTEGTGKIRLEDVNVESAISVKSNDSDTLELHNVKAPRLIINNPKANMTVSVTGNTDIDVVELRTKSSVKQSELGTDFAGVDGVVVTPSEAGGEVDAKLDGLNLRTLETNAATVILAFANNTRVEALSADSSLSITGDGKISSLSIGSKTGQGAGDLDERKDIVLFVKDVSIANLNVKSPAVLNLSTAVDSISTSDAVTIGGEASVGTLTLNPKANSASRLLIDIVSANIQSVYSNTPSRISVTGSSRINELTADESTYVLGNKVNHLRVNADGVIYENEPDKITVAPGIRPPQSKADNPNMDYGLVAPAQNTSTIGEDFATTCGHSRESGGFLLGDGSVDSPYEVSNALQLAHTGLHLASHFVQTADVDIAAESSIANNFPSIGSASAPFEGVFDGKGFAIANLNIISQDELTGLFGANKGVIQNVRVYSGAVTAASTSPSLVGGVVGLNFDGGQIRSCANGATVTGNQNARTGGIAGGNYGGRIHDCYNYAKISGVDIVGGIVGLNRQGASVTGSYNVGLIDARDEVGSVAGKNEDGTIANCYFLTATSGYGIGAGSGTATEKTAEELAGAQMSAELSAGNEASLWISGSSSGNYRYPVHKKPE